MNERTLEAKIVAAVSKAMKTYCEKWVTAETLGEHIETLNPNWLKRNGSCFNRTRVEWDDETGHHTGSWLYPLHEIQEMVMDGRIKQLHVK